MSIAPEEIIDGRRVVVCVGSGGVGKTTISASLALGGARRGRRVLVLTIDPAKRLADALGVRSLGNTPRAIPRKVLDRLGVPAEGRLSAMMLDMKRTFDDLVERFAEDTVSRNRILENPIYQHASDALAGSAEYSAMEKVFELSERKDFDLIVLDTPPSQHALEFLEAPQRLLEFLDSRLVHLLLHPAFAAGGAQSPGAGLGDLVSGGHLRIPARLRGHVRGISGASGPGPGAAVRSGERLRPGSRSGG
jgi:anion-transporting  ArsA/GET3 family ATPase